MSSAQKVLSSSSTYARAVDIVARHTGLDPGQVLRPSRHVERRARATAVYLTIVGGGHSQRPTSAVSGVSRTTLREWLRKIEDRRDDPVVDHTLTRLEEQLLCAI